MAVSLTGLVGSLTEMGAGVVENPRLISAINANLAAPGEAFRQVSAGAAEQANATAPTLQIIQEVSEAGAEAKEQAQLLQRLTQQVEGIAEGQRPHEAALHEQAG